MGQAGLLADPNDSEALAQEMGRMLADTDLQEEMRVAGIAQAKGFSWQKTAVETVDSYRRALAGTGVKDRRHGGGRRV
jgi:alpha-1,3-rhamnosyl/mannosyltransferase